MIRDTIKTLLRSEHINARTDTDFYAFVSNHVASSFTSLIIHTDFLELAGATHLEIPKSLPHW